VNATSDASIHASVGERPPSAGPAIMIDIVSIHASAWEATRAPGQAQAPLRGFDPRFRTGSDQPPRRASSRRRCFDPRFRIGSDPLVLNPSLRCAGFRSTLPHGKRRGRRAVAWRRSVFRSTLPHGKRRLGPRPYGRGASVSIHASAWEATRSVVHDLRRHPVSIHASAWEATPMSCRRLPSFTGFDPRFRMGSDRRAGRRGAPPRGFDPRFRMGSDLLIFGIVQTIRLFRSTLPHGKRQNPRW